MNLAAPAIAENLLPPLLQDFVRIIGLPSTMALVERYGGLRIFVPTAARCDAEHPLAQIIGLDKLMLLADEYGGIEHFQLPKAERALKAVRNARIVADYAQKSARELAMEHRLTESQITRILSAAGAQPPPDRRQRALF